MIYDVHLTETFQKSIKAHGLAMGPLLRGDAKLRQSGGNGLPTRQVRKIIQQLASHVFILPPATCAGSSRWRSPGRSDPRDLQDG
jgi:hypothetical protein